MKAQIKLLVVLAWGFLILIPWHIVAVFVWLKDEDERCSWDDAVDDALDYFIPEWLQRWAQRDERHEHT